MDRMLNLRRAAWVLFLSLLSAHSVAAATGTPSDTSAAPDDRVPWAFSAGAYYYSFPWEEDYVVAVGIAEHGSLHLEGRYNYEDRRTGSLFAGWTFALGESFSAALTPMVGVAFGNTTGGIAALEAAFGWGSVDLYLESEYLLDFNDREGNFLYTWLELGLSPSEMFRAGLVAQRTRVFQTPLELDRGVFAQVNPAMGSFTVYAFNLFTESWFLVLAARIDW